MNRSRVLSVAMAVIALLLFPVDTNIAAGVLPAAWHPYLWVAWPVALILGVPLVCGQVRSPKPETRAIRQERLNQAADDLADAEKLQWEPEKVRLWLHSPAPIPVRWSNPGTDVARELSEVVEPDAERGGSEQGQVADMFRRLRSPGGLVIIGKQASGKSTQALLLTLDLLEGRREPEDLVPVLLSVSSWNPERENLHTWVARCIAEEYPALANQDKYGPGITEAMVTGKRVVPVLDGLDELHKQLRPKAYAAIDEVINNFPLVVTCRADQYDEMVKANKRLLANAAVLRLEPVNVDDAEKFLTETDNHRERWNPVLDHLRTMPGSPLAEVLSSPLMILLARVVCSKGDIEPDSLLRKSSRGELEDLLFEGFLQVAYPDQVVRDRAVRWLRFLDANAVSPATEDDAEAAAGSRSAGTGGPDDGIAWWRLTGSVPRPVRGIMVGCSAGLVLGLAVTPFVGLLHGIAYTVIPGFTVGCGYVFGRMAKLSRIAVSVRGNGLPLLSRALAGLMVGLAETPLAGPVFGCFAALTWMAALTVSLWLGALPDAAAAASPRTVLTQDRNATLVLGIGAGLLLGPLTAPGFHAVTSRPITGSLVETALITAVSNAFIGAIMVGFLFGRGGAIAGSIGVAALAEVNEFAASHHAAASAPGSQIAAGAAFTLAIAFMVAMSRAWGAFRLTQFALALLGRVPFRLMQFLDEAHRLGVLRQSGTVYQFRHENLREYLYRRRPGRHRAHPGRQQGAAVVQQDTPTTQAPGPGPSRDHAAPGRP